MNVFVSFWSLCVVNYGRIFGCFVANTEMANIVCVIVETDIYTVKGTDFRLSEFTRS